MVQECHNLILSQATKDAGGSPGPRGRVRAARPAGRQRGASEASRQQAPSKSGGSSLLNSVGRRIAHANDFWFLLLDVVCKARVPCLRCFFLANPSTQVILQENG